jgi:hypothetical protein
LIPALLTGQKRARPELKALVNEAFDTDKEGKYQYRACWHFVAWKLMMNAGSKPCRQSVKLCRSSVAVLISACMNVLWDSDEYRPIALDIAGAGVYMYVLQITPMPVNHAVHLCLMQSALYLLSKLAIFITLQQPGKLHSAWRKQRVNSIWAISRMEFCLHAANRGWGIPDES